MLHHLSFGVSDMDRSSRFYDAVLGALGFVRVWDDLGPDHPNQAIGYGRSCLVSLLYLVVMVVLAIIASVVLGLVIGLGAAGLAGAAG